VLVSVISLLYNLYKNRHLKIAPEGISFIDRFRSKTLNSSDIEEIRLAREPGRFRNIASRLIRVRIKNRKRLLVIRPNDYENVSELLNSFKELKRIVESR
jgi:hypothetical protein